MTSSSGRSWARARPRRSRWWPRRPESAATTDPTPAPPLPQVPAIVLSADKFLQPSALKPDNYTQAQIHQANDLLAAALGTTNVIVPGTGHNQMLYQRRSIADQIVTIVDDVRQRQ